MAEGPDKTQGQPRFAEAALFGCCPRCGARALFAGWTRFAERCRACGLDFSRSNVGDGPAAFLTLIIGAVVVFLAVWLELGAGPPWWLHVLLWPPLVIAGVVFGLRIAKAGLFWSEFRNRAGEGRERTP